MVKEAEARAAKAPAPNGAVRSQPSSQASQSDVVLDQALFGLRWSALAAVLVLGLLDPTSGRLGLTTADLAAMVAAYYLIVEAIRSRSRGTISYGNLAVLDATAISAADLIAGHDFSPIFLLYFPPLIGAAVGMRAVDSAFLTFAIGLLSTSIVLTQPDWRWEPEQLQFLGIRLVAVVLFGLVTTALSRQLGIQRWSTELERNAAARLALLNDLLRATSSRLELDQIMETVAAMTRRGVGSDAAIALLLERDGGQTRLWASGDFSAGALTQSATELVRAVARRGRPFQVHDARFTPEARALFRLGLRSLLAAPLEADGRVLGVLLVGARAPNCFDAAGLDWLLTIAQHAALPIRNARLREMERSNAARLAELEKAKSSFLSGVSHDLRTPLTSIKVAAGLLTERRQEDGDDSERSLLASLRRNTERLEKLVDDILDMVRIQGGAVRLRPELLDARGLIREVALSVKPMLDARGQSLEFALPETSVSLWGDRRRLEQVVANLVSNATKYSHDGARISVTLEEQPDHLLIRVADDGPGIPPAERDRVFQPFYRSARDDAPGGGAGLGLAIARSLIELHGGRIWLEDKGGRGTLMTFSLPRKLSSESANDEGVDY